MIRAQNRESIQQYLNEQGVSTMIHYPVPPHKQEAYNNMNDEKLQISEKIHQEVLSLPIGPHLSKSDMKTICEAFSEARLKNDKIKVNND